MEEIPALDIDAVNISSTKIRTALTEGNVELATTYLGHPYIIGGEVIKGDQIGRSIGFPTANLDINFQHKLIPADAVYAGYVRLNGEHHKAMANIGRRPTVGSNRRSVEIHLLDFERDLYGQHLHFAVGHRLRDVTNFNSLDALKTQLALDKEDALSKLA